MDIIPYRDTFKDSVLQLILTIQQKEFNISITGQDQPDLNEIQTFYQKGNGNFWIALEADECVGTIAVLDIGNHILALRKMFVHPLFRGPKHLIGQKLLNTAFSWAGSKKIESIYLGTTEQFKAAQRFYEKNGFVEIIKKDLPGTFPLMQVDVKFYHYALNP